MTKLHPAFRIDPALTDIDKDGYVVQLLTFVQLCLPQLLLQKYKSVNMCMPTVCDKCSKYTLSVLLSAHPTGAGLNALQLASIARRHWTTIHEI